MLKRTAALVGSKELCVSGLKFCAISSPTDYYMTLKSMVGSASFNITMSALYLGCGKLEIDLIREVEKALSDPKRPNLKVTVILDHSRALRGEVNSATMCSRLIKDYPARFSLLLYQVPQLRRSVFSNYLPGQLKEVLGVYHCKFNVFDDCAILTGANLSNDYFTDRQDRYLKISNGRGSSSVVAYLEDFTSVLSSHCYRVTHDQGLLAPTAPLESLAEDLRKLNFPIGEMSTSKLEGSVMLPVIQHTMMGIHQEKKALISLIDATSKDHLLGRQQSSNSSSSDANPHIKIATPYTSFKSSLMQALLRAGSSGAAVSIVNPSAQAHGFAGATGVKSLVPKLHQCAFEQAIEDHSAEEPSSSGLGLVNFIQWLISSIVDRISLLLKSASSSSSRTVPKNVLPSIREFRRGDWSFHTKGMWFCPPGAADSKSLNGSTSSLVAGLPLITYIGSSNFGARSWTRDFELGFVLASEVVEMREIMQAECVNIEKWCSDSTNDSSRGSPETFKLSDSERLWLPVATRLVKSFL